MHERNTKSNREQELELKMTVVLAENERLQQAMEELHKVYMANIRMEEEATIKFLT